MLFLGTVLRRESSWSKKLYENQVGAWIRNYAKTKGMNMTNDACSLMTALLGTELSKIENELEKLKIAIGTERPIELGDVPTSCGAPKTPQITQFSTPIAPTV